MKTPQLLPNKWFAACGASAQGNSDAQSFSSRGRVHRHRRIQPVHAMGDDQPPATLPSALPQSWPGPARPLQELSRIGTAWSTARYQDRLTGQDTENRAGIVPPASAAFSQTE